MQFDSSLPVTEIIPQLLAALKSYSAVILQAPPGAGKTTLVPLALLESFPFSMETASTSGKIIITQPRRLAARMTAARMAQLHQSTLGSMIGYQVRMERRWSSSTRVIAMTTGVLLRRLLSDPFLEEFEIVILDEFHERALELDLVLGMLKRLRETVRPDLKILVMSATLDCGPVAEFLNGAPVIESAGRCFEVAKRYAQTASLDKIELSVANILPAALAATPGHLLVFLPGVAEIVRTHRAIETLARDLQIQVFRLYGEMPAGDQDRVLLSSANRKIILATNVAETSLTIDGVTGVIDSGWVRVMRYHPELGLSRLVLEPNSLASADQRAGRAGRQAPGVCFRLWPESLNRTRSPFNTPEILRSDLAGALLQLAGMGESEWEAFPWLTPPKQIAVETAKLLLRGLGALQDDRITAEGERLLRIPAAPRLAKLMLTAQRLGIPHRGALATALLGERDVFRANQGSSHVNPSNSMKTSAYHNPAPTKSLGQTRSDSDLVDRVGRLEFVLAGGHDPELSRAAAERIEESARQLLQSLPDPVVDPDESEQVTPIKNSGTASAKSISASSLIFAAEGEMIRDDQLRQAIGEAYPDRIARRRVNGGDRALMVGGIGVKLAPTSAVKDAELFACIDVEHREGDSLVRLASAIEFDWLPAGQLQNVTEYFFNPSTRSVQARKRTYWYDLVIAEHSAALADDDQIAQILLAETKKQWEQIFPMEDPFVSNFLARVRWIREAFPKEEWPELSLEDLYRIAGLICRRKKNLDEIKHGAWGDFLLSLLSYEQQTRLNALAPVDWIAPSGNRIRIDYASGSQPKISVRLQELFGLSDTPRLIGGRVVCLLELLGPNYRPQQLTSDLASFWQNTYPSVRKELLRRYPKHHWPEDPRATAATRSGLKRDAK